MAADLVQEAAFAGWRIRQDVDPGKASSPSLMIGTLVELTTIAPDLDLATGRIVVGDGPGEVGDEVFGNAAALCLPPLLQRWSPLPFPPAARRQREVFGPTAIDPLLVHLHDRLAAILVAGIEEARAAAHQLAGLAGTLGFADLSQGWERFSAEGESRRADARRLARLSLATLRRAGFSGGGA